MESEREWEKVKDIKKDSFIIFNYRETALLMKKYKETWRAKI